MILDSLILQTKLFLQEDMNININDIDTKILDTEQLSLKQYTSMIGGRGKTEPNGSYKFRRQPSK